MKAPRIPLRVVLYKEDGRWFAHCLEFDLIGDGATKKEASRMLAAAINIQVEQSLAHDNPASLFSPAEGKYFEMFAAGRDVLVGELELTLAVCDSITMGETEAREYSGDDRVPA